MAHLFHPVLPELACHVDAAVVQGTSQQVQQERGAEMNVRMQMSCKPSSVLGCPTGRGSGDSSNLMLLTLPGICYGRENFAGILVRCQYTSVASLRLPCVVNMLPSILKHPFSLRTNVSIFGKIMERKGN